MIEITGKLTCPQGKIAIVVAQFNEMVTQQLAQGAKEFLLKLGMTEENIVLVRVPGAFELPFILRRLMQTDKFSGMIALGGSYSGTNGAL